jgi:hypothetical protein
MPADPQAQRRQDLYDTLILERDVPTLLDGLTVDQYLSRLPQRSTSPETEQTPPQLALHGLQ